MNKSDLRKVEYKLYNQVKQGYFHQWFNSKDSMDGFQVNNLYAVVESEDGHIMYIDPQDIKFI